MKVARKPLIAGNWKMHNTVGEALELVGELRRLLAQVRNVEVVVAPPFTALHPVAGRLRDSRVLLAAQNVHPAPKGAFTGEVSVPMLKDVGCTYVIVGHSERRQHFGETDAGVAARVRAVLDGGLSPIVCLGETLAERDQGFTMDRIATQVGGCLAPVTPEEAPRVVVAYEPVWAIGTGRTATPGQAQEVHAFIRGLLRDRFGAEVASVMRILYGGSVRPDNIDGLMAQPDIDGALVGGASLEAASFARIVKFNASVP